MTLIIEGKGKTNRGKGMEKGTNDGEKIPYLDFEKCGKMCRLTWMTDKTNTSYNMPRSLIASLYHASTILIIFQRKKCKICYKY